MPDSDDWTAYAIVAGVPPGELESTEFLVDPDGWLRAVIRPTGAAAWPDADRVAAAIKDAQAHPIASNESSAMHHHH
jgi:hypothetical protein